MTDTPRWQARFPTFPANAMPPMPEGFVDETEGDCAAPVFWNADKGLFLTVYDPSPSRRENPDPKVERFHLHRQTRADGVHPDTEEHVVSSDRWFVITRAMIDAGIPQFHLEFPDYPIADMPPIPEGFADQSWHNSSGPSFWSESLKLSLFVDYADPANREVQEWKRFSLSDTDEEGGIGDELLSTDDWNEVVAFVEKRKAAA